jgi:bile acid-coenzyme A ligase
MSEETPLGVLVGRLAQAAPDRPAITCGEDTVSRIELEARTNRLARAYACLGVTRDAFVTIGLPNGIEFFEATLAAWKLGATPQPVSSRLPAAERRAIIDLANPVLVVGVDQSEAPGRVTVPAGFEPTRRWRPTRCRPWSARRSRRRRRAGARDGRSSSSRRSRPRGRRSPGSRRCCGCGTTACTRSPGRSTTTAPS